MNTSGVRSILIPGVILAAAVAGMFIPIRTTEERGEAMTVKTVNLDPFDPAPPSRTVRLLFIHHSCGGQWLAPEGPNEGTSSIYTSARNGGGLRDRLVANGYEVHEASYGSLVGGKTDIFDWPPKFRDHMEAVITCEHQDAFYSDERRNDVVVFKSCFNNNGFVGPGREPGDPAGPALTVANAKAAYRSLLDEFAKHPDVLFVAVTAPPLALSPEPAWKVLARRVLGRPGTGRSGPYARAFNNWLNDANTGWLSAYSGTNVVVFDLYDVLTDEGASNFLRYPSGPRGVDSHPNLAGNRAATKAFVPFLNRVVRRQGLAATSAAGPASGRDSGMAMGQED